MNNITHSTIKIQFYKLAAILGFILVLVAIIFAWNSPATGYEPSIYLSTPLICWILLFIASGLGVGIILFKTGDNESGDKNWLIGLLLIWLVNLVILSLPCVRNYFFMDGTGDTGQHLGWVQDLLASGHTSNNNLYPITHILFGQFSLILRIPPLNLFNWGLLLFAPISFVSIYLICNELLSNKRQIALASLFGSILFQNWYTFLAPNAIANMLFPFIIYVLIKVIKASKQRFQFTILILLLSLLIIPLHPVPALAFLFVVLAIWLWHIKSKSYNDKLVLNQPIGGPLVLFVTVWFIVWLSSFGNWDTTLRNLYILITGRSQTQLQSIVNQATYATQYGFNVLTQFLKLYGGMTVYIFLAFFGFFIFWRRRSVNKDSYLLNPIAWSIIIICLAMLIMFFINFVFSPLRLLAFIIFLGSPFVGIALSSFISLHNLPHWSMSIRIICTGIIFMILSTTAILVLYQSPYTLNPNLQNTKSEISGMGWFLNNKDMNIPSTGWYYDPSVYASYLLNANQRKARNDLTLDITQPLPYLLGYDNNKELGQNFTTNIYVVMTQLTRTVYTYVYPKMASIRLTTNNLNQLENDPSVYKVYSTDKGFDIYYVQAN
jgi:hypothetical protein